MSWKDKLMMKMMTNPIILKIFTMPIVVKIMTLMTRIFMAIFSLSKGKPEEAEA